MAKIALEQILFSQGFGSRKRCRMMIVDGLVTVDDTPCDAPSAVFDVGDAASGSEFFFTVEGVRWQYQKSAYLMLHKPAEFECSQKPKSHASVYALLPAPLRDRGVQAVGRLDVDTTGLLLFSDDGQFIHRMASPKHHVPKIYHVTTAEPVREAQRATLLTGVVLEDDPAPVRAIACDALDCERPRIALTLTSGKYHQVKRMLAAVGNHVIALHRDRIGGLSLPPDLQEGQWRWLQYQELALVSQG